MILFTAAAERAGQRHLVLLTAMEGRQFEASFASNALSEQGSRELTDSLLSMASPHVEDEYEQLEADMLESASAARIDALSHLGLTSTSSDANTLSDVLTASQQYAKSEIAQQIRRDIEQFLRRHRELRLQVSMAARTTGQPSSMLQLRIASEGVRRKTWFTDRSGRRWPSQKFIRVVWRQAMLNAYLETYLLTAAERGEREVFVWHPDRTHRHFGERISLDDGSASFELKETVFHPNSDALPRVSRFLEL